MHAPDAGGISAAGYPMEHLSLCRLYPSQLVQLPALPALLSCSWIPTLTCAEARDDGEGKEGFPQGNVEAALSPVKLVPCPASAPLVPADARLDERDLLCRQKSRWRLPALFSC